MNNKDLNTKIEQANEEIRIAMMQSGMGKYEASKWTAQYKIEDNTGRVDVCPQVKIFTQEGINIPEYKTLGSSGCDLQGNIKKAIELEPLERILIPTGIFVEIPYGYEIQIRPRSGKSLKQGLVAILGTIDSDYRGELGVIVVNLSNKPFIIQQGEPIAQMVLAKVEKIHWIKVASIDEFSSTDRGNAGFGSTDKK